MSAANKLELGADSVVYLWLTQVVNAFSLVTDVCGVLQMVNG